MVDSIYRKDVAVPSYDEAVTAKLDYPHDGGAHEMVVAIENADGEVYRVAKMHGMGAYLHVCFGLLNIGLIDLLKDTMGTVNGYDSRFAVDPATRTQALAAAPSLVDPLADIEAADQSLQGLAATERAALIQARIGQGQYRQRVIEHWQCCAVTGATCLPLLRASHIKPWRVASNVERLDHNNGLLLTPNLDAAFDSGYISFDEHGRVMVSPQLTGEWAYALHISAKTRLNPKRLSDGHREFLKHHRAMVYRK